MSTPDWAKNASMEKLLQIRTGYRAHIVEHRVADEEIRRREAETSGQVGTQRHQESLAVELAALAQHRRANRIALWALGVAVVALAVAILGWMFPHEPRTIGRAEPATPQPVAAPATNTMPGFSK